MKLYLLACLSLLSLCSCQGADPSTSLQNNTQRPLRLTHRSMPRALDPRQGYESGASVFIKLLFDGLMRMGPDGTLIHAMAESYEVSEDQKTYIFHLREALWSDGKKVTAYDFAYGWKSIINPKTATRAAHLFYAIKNVEAIIQGKVDIEEVGIYPLDDNTLKVELEFPAPYFLEALATAPYAPVPSDLDKNNPKWFHETENFVSNGPFLLKAWHLEQELILTKNPEYWNKEAIHLPSIHTYFVKDETTGLLLFQKGKIDWFGRPWNLFPPDAVSSLIEKGDMHFQDAFIAAWYFLNNQKFPFNNKKMRLAFAYALNRQEIVDHVSHESSVAMKVFNASLALQQDHYFEDAMIDTAQDLFKEGLQELGLTRETFPSISLSAPSSEGSRRVTQAVQQQWQKALGVNIQLDYQEWNSFHTFVASGGHQIAYMGWASWTRDPMYVLNTFKHAQDSMNMTKWEDIRYQKLLDKAEREVDGSVRKELLHDAERLLMEEMPFIPFSFGKLTFVANPHLKDVVISDLFDADFTWARWDMQ